MSNLFKFRCRCYGANGYATSRCVSRTTRKSVICKECDNCKGDGRKLARLRTMERLLVGERTR